MPWHHAPVFKLHLVWLPVKPPLGALEECVVTTLHCMHVCVVCIRVCVHVYSDYAALYACVCVRVYSDYTALYACVCVCVRVCVFVCVQ